MFFFFKQKTAYEIVSRDWSSDVCSSDLRAREHMQRHVDQETAGWTWWCPRVLALLGENRQTVEEAFHHRGRVDTGLARNKEMYHIRLGEYLEHIGDNKQAIQNFSIAVSCGNNTESGADFSTKYAQNRLKKLQR